MFPVVVTLQEVALVNFYCGHSTGRHYLQSKVIVSWISPWWNSGLLCLNALVFFHLIFIYFVLSQSLLTDFWRDLSWSCDL